MVTDQWSALRRLLCWPVLIMLAPMVLWHALLLMPQRSSSERIYYAFYAFSLFLMLTATVVAVGAVSWLGMWFGLRGRGRAGAALRASSLATIPPYLIAVLSSSVLWGLARSRGNPVLSYIVWWLAQFLNLLFYIFLMRLAKQRLLEHLSGNPPLPISLREFFSHVGRGAAATIRKVRGWTPKTTEQ